GPESRSFRPQTTSFEPMGRSGRAQGSRSPREGRIVSSSPTDRVRRMERGNQDMTQVMTRARLRPLTDSSRQEAIDMAAGESLTIGRSDQADVVVDDPSLSRVHARIRMSVDGAM